MDLTRVLQNNFHEASALLLENNPITLGRVTSHLSAPKSISIDESKRLIRANVEKTLASATPLKKPSYLSWQTAQKMINRFLTEQNMSVDQLATSIGVAANKLAKLSAANYEEIAPVINLPLIKLYCRTRWAK